MIQVRIDSLMVSFAPMPSIVTLCPLNKSVEKEELKTQQSILPIWVGPTEATAIAAAVEGKKSSRPLTHTLINDLVKSAGAKIARVIIDRVDGSTFYSSIVIAHKDGNFSAVDARPSDAIALAVRADVPLFVEDEVMKIAAAPASMAPGADEQIEMEEFHKFIETVSPEDFSA